MLEQNALDKVAAAIAAAEKPSLLDIAWLYRHLGFSVIPLRNRSKLFAPIIGGLPLSDEEFKTCFSDVSNYGIGLVMGKDSNNIIALDFDNVDVYKVFSARYPDVFKTATSNTSRGHHVLLRVKELPPFCFKYPDIDVISTGWYIAVWPSIHPSGTWESPPWDRIACVDNLAAIGIEIPDEAEPDYGDYGDDHEYTPSSLI